MAYLGGVTDAADHYADPAYDAARYDAIHAGQTRDVAFYVDEVSRAGGPALEVGCGTGRAAEGSGMGVSLWLLLSFVGRPRLFGVEPLLPRGGEIRSKASTLKVATEEAGQARQRCDSGRGAETTGVVLPHTEVGAAVFGVRSRETQG